MSQTLAGLLQPRILSAFQSFGTAEYSGPIDPAAAQQKMALELSRAIAEAVQIYLQVNVNVLPGQATIGGPSAQVTATPGILTAP
jgi:hypothetical protein